MNARAAGPEQIGQKADAIYEASIRPLVEPEQNGKIVAIDVDTGDYEVDDNVIPATRRLRERRPNGSFFARRIGADALSTFGPSIGPAKQ